jgi:transposase
LFGSCDLLGKRQGCGDWRQCVDFGALEGLIVFKHAEDGVEEFAHDGDEGLHFGFAAGQQELQMLPLREGRGRRREDLLQLVRQLSTWIKELDQRIEQEVARRPEAQRLMTHPGVGPQTALATVLVLGPVERFPIDRHLASYLGLIPEEDSSGGRQRFGHLTKQGNRLRDPRYRRPTRRRSGGLMPPLGEVNSPVPLV